MSQTLVYMGVVIGLMITTLSALTSLTSPTWIVYHLSTPTLTVYDHIGLFSRCSPSGCIPFPSIKFCSSLIPRDSPQPALAPHHHPSPFCTKWRSAGFLVNISVVANLVAFVTAAFILLSNASNSGNNSSNHAHKRHGSRILAVLMILAGAMELGAVGIISEVIDYERMFLVPGYELGRSWWVGLGGGVLSLLMGLGVGMVRLMETSVVSQQ
ncbi:hypothetical protein QBC41DRAFT_345176 [Cercophora samala]|uniref:Uncharacterized protein n=1 Tax=Cercophora samala TaxID=330535 RepID=A0AA40DBW4_9PEZI|nr:hypothetical protein QBC41DRAFT_345176 [Cercophora samala]